MNETAAKWNTRYIADASNMAPCKLLAEHDYLLPGQGLALDLACGLAGNAFFMAKKGLSVDAVDISTVAIDRVNQQAQQENLPVKGVVRDIENDGMPGTQYDVIVVSNYLKRDLMAEIIEQLAPSGLLFYQTWSVQKVAETGPQNPDYLLKNGELLTFCKNLDVVFYQEDGLLGDLSRGWRNQAGIIAVR